MPSVSFFFCSEIKETLLISFLNFCWYTSVQYASMQYTYCVVHKSRQGSVVPNHALSFCTFLDRLFFFFFFFNGEFQTDGRRLSPMFDSYFHPLFSLFKNVPQWRRQYISHTPNTHHNMNAWSKCACCGCLSKNKLQPITKNLKLICDTSKNTNGPWSSVWSVYWNEKCKNQKE